MVVALQAGDELCYGQIWVLRDRIGRRFTVKDREQTPAFLRQVTQVLCRVFLLVGKGQEDNGSCIRGHVLLGKAVGQVIAVHCNLDIVKVDIRV